MGATISGRTTMIKLASIGHVLLRVADEEASKRFYCDALGFEVAEQDPQHGGVFMTLGDGFHAIDLTQAPQGAAAQPERGLGLIHIAFKVASYAALRDAYTHLLDRGVTILRAVDHICQRSVYFTDPDGNGLEIYYEMPNALSLFPNGRGDDDERLPLTAKGEPLPAWLTEDWPGATAMAKVERLASGASIAAE
jgi:catechol-2,3-dioxygenase